MSAAIAWRRSATTTHLPTRNFNGRIDWIQIDLGDDADDPDHQISPEERYRLATALQ